MKKKSFPVFGQLGVAEAIDVLRSSLNEATNILKLLMAVYCPFKLNFSKVNELKNQSDGIAFENSIILDV